MREASHKPNNGKTNKIILIASFAIVITVWAFWFLFFPHYTKDMQEAGQFGDMFGALNTLFTGLAFAGLVTTIILQRKQINISQKEALTSEQYISIQIFESKFFHLLDLLQKTISVTSYSGCYDKDGQRLSRPNITNDIKLEGHQAISAIYNDIRNKHRLLTSFIKIQSQAEREIKIQQNDEKPLSSCYEYYICSINILRLINNSPVKDASFYASVFVSHLSEDEKLLLVYNILRKTDIDHLFINKYHLLRGCNQSMLPAFVDRTKITDEASL